MVAVHEHDRVVGEARALERAQQLAQLEIGPRHRRVVAAPQLGLQRRRQRRRRVEVDARRQHHAHHVALVEAVEVGDGRRAGGRGRVAGDGNLGGARHALDHLGGHHPRQVRPTQAHHEQEGATSGDEGVEQLRGVPHDERVLVVAGLRPGHGAHDLAGWTAVAWRHVVVAALGTP